MGFVHACLIKYLSVSFSDKDKAGSFKISSGAFGSSGSSAFTFGASSGSAPSGDGGGFKIGDSGKSTTEGTTGGFKFGDSNSSSTGKTASATAGGFKFGDSNVTSTGKNVSSPVGGFKFGDSNTTTGKDASLVGGFKFGDSSESTKNDTTVTGGFVFGEKLAEKSNESGSLFGQNNSNKLTSESSKGDGFQFGNKQSDSTSSTLKESSTKSSFAIGQNNSNSIQTSFSGVNSDNSKTSDSTFKPVFGVTPSLDKPVENKLNGGDMVKTSSMFGQSTNTETSKGGFSFGSNLTSGSAGNSGMNLNIFYYNYVIHIGGGEADFGMSKKFSLVPDCLLLAQRKNKIPKHFKFLNISYNLCSCAIDFHFKKHASLV